jgi:hypothetical protein
MYPIDLEPDHHLFLRFRGPLWRAALNLVNAVHEDEDSANPKVKRAAYDIENLLWACSSTSSKELE